MPTYNKKLKRQKKGVIRYIGRNFAGHREKFYLGWDLREAERREKLIQELWEYVERHHHYMDGLPYWPKEHLKAAKAIAKGNQPLIPPTWKLKSQPDKYVASVNTLSKDFAPADQELYDAGIVSLGSTIRESKSTLAGRGNVELTGQTLGEALGAFRDNLHTAALLPDKKTVRPWGRTQLGQLETWRRYLDASFTIKNGERRESQFLNLDLAYLTQERCQELVDTVRSRPNSFASERNKNGKRTRLAHSTVSGILKVVAKFFEWLDTCDDFGWIEPRKFRLNRKPEPLTSDELYEKEKKKAVSTLTDDHIQLLSKYALPNERVILLCGLNFAFGPGELGQLRIPFIKSLTNEIVGVRFKTGNPTRHHVWDETMEALEWQLGQREQIKPKSTADEDLVFLTDGGQPVWRRTPAGNYSDGIGRRFSRLVKRVQKDHTDFPSYSIGKLRKTAATRILNLASAEAASLILAHKTISDDELLHHYVQVPWQKLYEAQKRFGAEIAPLLRLDRPAFVQPKKNYIGLQKIEKIKTLLAQGLAVEIIAREVGVSRMTIYRYKS